MEKIKNALRSPTVWSWILMVAVLIAMAVRYTVQIESILVMAYLENVTTVAIGVAVWLSSVRLIPPQRTWMQALAAFLVISSVMMFGSSIHSKWALLELRNRWCYQSYRGSVNDTFSAEDKPLSPVDVRVKLLSIENVLKACLKE